MPSHHDWGIDNETWCGGTPDDRDDRPLCPECGTICVRDSEGDVNVINGTRDFWTCTDCGGEVVDKNDPVQVTEDLFAWARKNGLMES